MTDAADAITNYHANINALAARRTELLNRTGIKPEILGNWEPGTPTENRALSLCNDSEAITLTRAIKAVNDALATLEQRRDGKVTRRMISMSYWQDATQETIADAVGLKPWSVGDRLRRFEYEVEKNL